MRRRGETSPGAVIAVAVIGIVLCLGVSSCMHNMNREVVTATVTSKEVKRSGESDRYMVFTDKETFTVSDSILEGNFRSSDIYGRLQEGKTYRFHVYGIRNGFMSMYRNIHEVEEVP